MKSVEELVEFADRIEGEGTARIPRDSSEFMCTMTIRELRAMAEHALKIPKGGVVVEIGVYCGRSASIVLNLQQDLDLDITLIDNWTWNAPPSKESFWHLMTREFDSIRQKVLVMEMPSHEAYEEWDKTLGREIDFIHIDACHDYEWVEKDCALWMPLVRMGGVACFHDYHEGEVELTGVRQAVDENCSEADGWERIGLFGRLEFRRKVKGA